MTRRLAPLAALPHGRLVRAHEPFVFHCNHYNRWLQSTLLLNPELGMAEVIANAAAEVAHHAITQSAAELGATDPSAIARIAEDLFAEHGFGRVDLSGVAEQGGHARFSSSHYGQCLLPDAPGSFTEPQSLFDRGFVLAAAAAMYGLPAGAFEGETTACFSVGDDHGEVVMRRRTTPASLLVSPGEGVSFCEGQPPPPFAGTSVDEASILAALSGLSFAGNEEGLTPRFGVILTHHFANFYDRISNELVRRMHESDMREAAELLLVDAGRRCGFHTFGGIMSSAEWDAVVRPQLTTKGDWVHGMVAVVNALGWGAWRVQEHNERRLVVRIYDDYESRGYAGTYGKAPGPICYLAQGGVESIMNLIYLGGIDAKPALDDALYDAVIDADETYRATQTRCMAAGDPYTEIVAER